jgi:hypothetical protein
MPRFVDYHCFHCGCDIEDVYYHSPSAVKDKIKCQCGRMAHRKLGSQVNIDGWSPMVNNAQWDIDHFEKKSKGRLYREDQTKQSVNHLPNLQEV